MKHKLMLQGKLLLALLMCCFLSVNAQDPSFSVFVANPNRVAANIYEFDVVVKAAGPTSTFQLRTFQGGIWVNPTWISGGSVSLSLVSGQSQLASPAYNGSLQWNTSNSFINMSVNIGVKSPSSCVSTAVSTSDLRVARVRITNSVAFDCNSLPDLKFNYVQNDSPLRLRSSVSWRESGCSVNYDMFYPNRPYTGQAYFNGELYTTSDADGRSPVYSPSNTFACSFPYSIQVFMEGYYLGAGSMQPVLINQGVPAATGNESDSVLIEIRTLSDPYTVAYSSMAVLNLSGIGTIEVPGSFQNADCWIVVKHRSSLETWSAAAIPLTASGSYNFSDMSSKAYGDNLVQVEPGVWAMFTGDLNQDQFIDAVDFPMFDSDNLAGACCDYYATDLNGDGFVDAVDFPFFDQNNLNGIFALTP